MSNASQAGPNAVDHVVVPVRQIGREVRVPRPPLPYLTNLETTQRYLTELMRLNRQHVPV